MNRFSPDYEQIMVEDGHVLSVLVEADGPGEPPMRSYEVTLPDGRTRVLDWSPWHFERPTRDDFKRWIRLGYPPRQGTGPWRSAKLEAMEREHAA